MKKRARTHFIFKQVAMNQCGSSILIDAISDLQKLLSTMKSYQKSILKLRRQAVSQSNLFMEKMKFTMVYSLVTNNQNLASIFGKYSAMQQNQASKIQMQQQSGMKLMQNITKRQNNSEMHLSQIWRINKEFQQKRRFIQPEISSKPLEEEKDKLIKIQQDLLKTINDKNIRISQISSEVENNKIQLRQQKQKIERLQFTIKRYMQHPFLSDKMMEIDQDISMQIFGHSLQLEKIMVDLIRFQSLDQDQQNITATKLVLLVEKLTGNNYQDVVHQLDQFI